MSETDPSTLLPRRTFAIISHPDAGKTTLTEKFLLYGGAIGLAGSVTARKDQRATASDWMELEKQRGISISSTLLQFDYQGYRVNLLDTPGHKDFSEDTYRVLTAVDAAVMVIDAGKGVESQTRKLFEVCRRRGVPIFTFMNKCDRPTRSPLDLIDELEKVLGIGAFPVNWPIGSGPTFRGVFDRVANQVHLFEKTPGGAFAAPVAVGGIDDPALLSKLDSAAHHESLDEVRMLDGTGGAGAAFDQAAVLAGKVTPVFFGSAMNNFGVQLLLDGFLKHSSPPTPRMSKSGLITPDDKRFSGFVFKIQANMDPRHRDRIAFLRVVSGTFDRDMFVVHAQTGKRVRLGNATKLFGNQRETVEQAVAGDVVGLVGNDLFGIGDTLTDDRTIVYDEIPEFSPEVFAYLHNPQPGNYKRFNLGLEQLLREGVARKFEAVGGAQKVALLAAVGQLQFEVLVYRLQNEYGAESRLEPASWTMARWWRYKGQPAPTLSDMENLTLPDAPEGSRLVFDDRGRALVLFVDQWPLRFFSDRNPTVELSPIPFDKPAAVAAT
ncbi:MAG: peptide chain release factor 3 [Phycisphaerales bacterium]|jgi:peptide chain release factor 3|nr:peptide chain release factor 3 [Phycisphaeraceae bacterium]